MHIGVVKFSAVWSDAPTDSKKCLSGGQHAYRRCDEIDPEGVPITSVSGGAKGSRGVHAHSGKRYFKRDVHGVERTHKMRRVPRQPFVVRHKQYESLFADELNIGVPDKATLRQLSTLRLVVYRASGEEFAG
jgi:hypothetical protein